MKGVEEGLPENEAAAELIRSCLDTMDSLVSDYRFYPTFFREECGLEMFLDEGTTSDEDDAGELAFSVFSNILYAHIFDDDHSPEKILQLLDALGSYCGDSGPGLNIDDLRDGDYTPDHADLPGWIDQTAETIIQRVGYGWLEEPGIHRLQEVVNYFRASATSGSLS